MQKYMNLTYDPLLIWSQSLTSICILHVLRGHVSHSFVPGPVAQSVECPTADPVVMCSISFWSNTFVEIDNEIF